LLRWRLAAKPNYPHFCGKIGTSGTQTRPKGLDDCVGFLHNLAPSPRELVFATGPESATREKLVKLRADDHSEADETGKHHVPLEGLRVHWDRLRDLDYLLQRTEI
jgi:maltose alpha-D-glucosyltransferase/alpha-amylase